MSKLFLAGSIFLISSVLFSCSDSDSDEILENVAIEENPVDAQKLLELVNEVRSTGTTCGNKYYPPVGELTWNSKLEQAALNHSEDMSSNNFFNHDSPDGRTLADRVTEVGYKYSWIGENIALGYTSEESVIDGWLNSEGHCANIMNPNYTEMGVGRVGNYWTQNFGKPRQ